LPITASFEAAAVDVLAIKANGHSRKPQRSWWAGGSHNWKLRDRLKLLSEKLGWWVFSAAGISTDNGAMIACAGYLRLAAGQREPLAFGARRWRIEEIGDQK
jgi:N6-L-threonylcarbamoyladenine synthase